MEKTIQKLQIKALNKLKLSILFVFFITLGSIAWDIVQKYNGDPSTCNARIWNEHFYLICWFCSRTSQCESGTFLTLLFFYKRSNPKTKKKSFNLLVEDKDTKFLANSNIVSENSFTETDTSGNLSSFVSSGGDNTKK